MLCVVQDGVVLGADTRATEGYVHSLSFLLLEVFTVVLCCASRSPIVADKNCAKIHKLGNFIYCCGAGTSADTENVTGSHSSRCSLVQFFAD